MGAPGILTGSNANSLFRQTGEGTQPSGRTGVFGANPGATPKYAINASGTGRARDAEYRDTLARLFIEIPPEQMETFLASVSAETRPLARVLAGGGNTAGTSGTGFIDFLLTSAQESLQEKAQIVETLTDHYVAFYSGQTSPVFNYSGVVLNTYQDDQRVWLMRLYSEILRGTRLAHRGLVAKLRYDSFIIAGYLESLNMGLTGEAVDSASFNFTFRVKRFSIFTPSLGAPTVVEVNDTSGAALTSVTSSQSGSARLATVTPEVPPTASAVPGADGGTTLSDDEIRERLRATGMPDVQIDAAIEAGNAAGVLAEIDPRETEIVTAAEGLDRVAAHVQGDGTEVNPDSVQEDGAGGMTNVYGQDATLDDELSESGASTVQTQQVRRAFPTRRRGLLAVLDL